MNISIITVCYNSAATIRDTLESVLAQTHPNIEYIIVDGASTDATLAIIAEYRDRITHLISEPDHGLYDAINKGIKLATGDFIGILNSDDLFYDNLCIAKLAEFIGLNLDADAVYSDLIYVKRHDTSKKIRSYRVKHNSLWNFRIGYMIPHPTFYAKRELFEKFGLYKTNYKIAADFELILRFMLYKINIKRLPIVTVKMREGGISNAKLRNIIHLNLEIIRACKENNFYTNWLLLSIKIPFKVASLFL
ncbi:MAG: glycosyltransferase [Candidatus Electrothrix sp. MAN1_4]|nr:glycosyltransferase [Candidatus Electrothrix sp. MAN1_4]